MNMEIKIVGYVVDVWVGWGELICGYFEKEC